MQTEIVFDDSTAELLRELGNFYGILPEYWDIYGNCHKTSLLAYYRILQAMGVEDFSAKALEKQIKHIKMQQALQFSEPVFVISVNNQPFEIPFTLPLCRLDNVQISINELNEAGDTKTTTISGNDITVIDVVKFDDTTLLKCKFSDFAYRLLGYYKLSFAVRGLGEVHDIYHEAVLIVTPDACYIPPAVQSNKAWGVSTSLYSLVSKDNWGIGDFADLFELTKWLSNSRAAFVGINPLHYISNEEPYGISPYSPLSRLYKNPIYIDIKSIPDFIESTSAQDFVSQEGFVDTLTALQKEQYVRYPQIADIKIQVLRLCYEHFKAQHLKTNTERAQDFEAYINEQGDDLEDFCTYLALRDYYIKSHQVYVWQSWDDSHQDPHSKAVSEFKIKYKDEIQFYKYCQWIIDGQLRRIATYCKNTWMPIGVYQDLAVGSNSSGSDVWAYKDIFASHMNVGAPPDDFNVNGQDWGFPPIIPQRLRQSGYEYLIKLLRHNMRHSGALRIDHALGLFRLFWIPEGCHAKDGSYVSYPAEDILRIIALESVRNRTVIIAEDLGTVPEEIKERLRQMNMLSYKLLYFERAYDGTFTDPKHYPVMSLCTTGTHDLPTFPAFYSGLDITVRHILGLNQSDYEAETARRKHDIDAIMKILSFRGLAPEASLIDIIQAVYEWLAEGSSILLALSFDDIALNYMQQNIPGLTTEYPCWKVKSKTPLEDIFTSSPINALISAVKSKRNAS